jgi:hypothetical protein
MNILKKLFREEAKSKEIYRKDIADKCVAVTKLRGVQYYRFKDDLDIPYGRYIYLASFMQAIELRMDLKTLNGYIEIIDKNLSGGKGVVDVGKCIITLAQLKTRVKILFDEELAYNLASCVFFTDDEPINTYDMEKNKKKIAEWREAGTLDFFMATPVRELLGLTNLSVTDLMTYLEQTRPMLEELNSVMHTAINNERSTK